MIGLLSGPLCACTAIGWLIGHSHDKNAAPKPVPPLQVASLDKGKRVELTLRDGSVVAGSLQGLEPVPQAQYRERWKESLQTLASAAALPPLGKARLTTKKGSADVTLIGLRPGALTIVEPGHAATGTVPLDSVAALGVPGGGSIDGVALARLAQEGQLPFLDALVVKTSENPRRLVSLESIRSATFKSGKGALTGALAGAVVDAVVIGLFIHEMNNFEVFGPSTCPPNSPTCTSCPTVYSHGERGPRLEAEPLGGSLLAADEAIDRAPLAQLEPTRGAYRLSILNQMRETEHLDAVRLLVVDHAAGAEVVPAMDGSLHLVRDAEPPLTAFDATGANLAPILASDDSWRWVESPLARDAEDPASRRATAVLEFRRPPGARTAVLDLSLQATGWGLALFGHVLELQGRALDSFWTRLETDARARRAFRAAWAREALPRIEIETTSGWRAAGTLAHIPLLVAGRRAVRLDLRDLEGERLRVRVDALPGLWAFDRIGVDYGARPVTASHVLAPRSARDASGADVGVLVAGSDDRRLTLAATRGRVDLAFAVPAPLPGSTRSMLVELEGYYRPLLAASGEPQSALFERLVGEPGALARYALAGVDASTRPLVRLAAVQKPR